MFKKFKVIKIEVFEIEPLNMNKNRYPNRKKSMSEAEIKLFLEVSHENFNFIKS